MKFHVQSCAFSEFSIKCVQAMDAGNVPYSLNIGGKSNVICEIVLEYFVGNPMRL